MGNNNDVSREALSLARAIDRLPLGEFMVQLVKRHRRDGGWSVEISKSETVRRLGVGHGRKQQEDG